MTPTTPRDRARILVVDDEAGMLRSVERILNPLYEVKAYTDPREALASAQAFRPEIAVVDIQMHGMDGFELLGRLKELDERIQVILMTGSIFEIDAQLVRAIRDKAFYYITKPFDRGVLLTLIARALELAHLQAERDRNLARLQRELTEAGAFQRAMLPPARARVAGLEVAAGHWPCAELAGDLYDFVEVSGDTAALLIADVVGHGASAAMLTSLVKSAFHANHGNGYEPLGVIRRTHEAIRAFDPSRFVTMIVARIRNHSGSGTIELVNAGHNGGFLARADGTVSPVEPTGPLVSHLWSEPQWSVFRGAWSPGDGLLLFTDGIPETERDGQEFGLRRLHDLVACPGAGDLAGRIQAALTEFTGGEHPADDVTVLHAYRPETA